MLENNYTVVKDTVAVEGVEYTTYGIRCNDEVIRDISTEPKKLGVLKFSDVAVKSCGYFFCKGKSDVFGATLDLSYVPPNKLRQ